MKALITGGAGFIGSHLADYLVSASYEVSVLDDLSTGSKQNIGHLIGSKGFEFHLGSVVDEQLVDKLVDNCDVVYHLAAAVGVRLVVEQPVKTIMNNVLGTETVLRAAARRRRPVLLTSTSEVYGKSTSMPFREPDDLVLGAPTRRRWSYASSKAIDEYLALAYWQQESLPVVVVRLFNTVGPRQVGRYGMVIPSFVDQALAGRPITVHGDGRQQRCFAFVGDVVKALDRLMNHSETTAEIINVGVDKEVSIRDLAERIKSRTGSKSDILHIPYEEIYGPHFEDMSRRVPDVSKLRRFLGGPLETDLDKILTSVIEHRRTSPVLKRVGTHQAGYDKPAVPLPRQGSFAARKSSLA